MWQEEGWIWRIKLVDTVISWGIVSGKKDENLNQTSDARDSFGCHER